jgi:hypothetical protein
MNNKEKIYPFIFFISQISVFQMKRNQKNHKSSGQKQTILNFFSKVGETKKLQPIPQSESVASLVKSTSTIDLTSKSTVSKPTVLRTVSASSTLKSLTSRDSFVKTEKNAIDLTLDTVDLTSDSEQNSPYSSQAEEIINTSKYSSRWWTPEIAKTGPILSSQETVCNRSDDDHDDDNTISVTITQKRQKSAINTAWVGPNDVQPFSAGHVSSTRKYSYGPRRSIPIKMLQPSAAKRKPDQGDIRGWGDKEYRASQETFYVDPSTKLGQFAHTDKRPKYERNVGTFGSSSSSPSALFNNHGSKQYRPELSAQQERVLNMVMNDRKNLFFTGSAGTGKSVLLRGKLFKIECVILG